MKGFRFRKGGKSRGDNLRWCKFEIGLVVDLAIRANFLLFKTLALVAIVLLPSLAVFFAIGSISIAFPLS
ncbi:Uncharacterized protein TCM_040255 [Theobroma cacao]|uniref:Uncharacterized protein n=1 Tax=Theobroma cacao TaxID=3641 RepID=A0A061GS81_THECC|nr:Uncharacterized protein TCM_040255 [Theobroma cacao]